MKKQKIENGILDGISAGATLVFGGYNEECAKIDEVFYGEEDPTDIYIKTTAGDVYKAKDEFKKNYRGLQSAQYGFSGNILRVEPDHFEKVENPQ